MSQAYYKNLTLTHEVNYMKIMRVLPVLSLIDKPAVFTFNIGNQTFTLDIKEITPYTSLIAIDTQLNMQNQWVPQIHLKVRVYHDARVAEAVNFQHHQRFLGKYNYPNPKMYQTNEKQQINRFLGEWLDYCIKTNCVLSDPASQTHGTPQFTTKQ